MWTCWSGFVPAHFQAQCFQITQYSRHQTQMSIHCLPSGYLNGSRLHRCHQSCLQNEPQVQLPLAGGKNLDYRVAMTIKTNFKKCFGHLYVLRNILSLSSWYVCLGVGSWFEPERYEPANKNDSSLKETLLGAVQYFTAILLPAHHTVVRLRTHRRHIYQGKETTFTLLFPFGFAIFKKTKQYN